MNWLNISFDKLIYWFLGNHKFKAVKVDESNLKHRFYPVKDSKTLYVNILGWNIHFRDSFSARKNINKKGFSCVTYQFPCGMLSPDIDLTKKNFIQVKKIILNDMKRYVLKYGFEKIIVSGTSLGGILAFLVSNGNRLVDELVLINPGYDLAESLWTSILTNKLRKKYENQGVTLKKLNLLWRDITPYKNLDKLKGKNIFIFTSKADKAISFSQADKLIKELKKRGYKVNCNINRFLGHYLTIFFTYKRGLRKLNSL